MACCIFDLKIRSLVLPGVMISCEGFVCGVDMISES